MQVNSGRVFVRGRPILIALISILVAGCSTPNKANIELRKQIQDLQGQVGTLQLQHQSDQATIKGLQSQVKTEPTLPESELDRLFTTYGLKFGGATGGYTPTPDKPGDTMLKVYVVPIDQQGEPIKAAGSFKVELFDLNLPKDNRIGKWDFDVDQTKADWNGEAFLYTYVLDCPWQTPPAHSNLTVRDVHR